MACVPHAFWIYSAVTSARSPNSYVHIHTIQHLFLTLSLTLVLPRIQIWVSEIGGENKTAW